MMLWLRRRIIWLGRCVRYAVVGAWPVLLIGAIFFVCYLSARFFSPAEPTIRMTGLLLQIGGFTMTMWQLLKTRKALNLPTWVEGVRNYFKGFPAFNRVVLMAGAIGAVGMVGRADAHVRRNPRAELQDRVERLEREMDALDARVTDLAVKNEAEIEALRKSSLEEVHKLRSELKDVENNVFDLLGGGTVLEVVGVFYFVTGLVLATASVELSKAIPPLMGVAQ